MTHKHCEVKTIFPSECYGPNDVIVDGRTINGPWANMCVGHHKAVGVGLGTGRGQKWRIDPESGRKIEKLEGQHGSEENQLMNTAKVEIVDQPVVRLTVELPPTAAAELAGLLANHVYWEDFPWAKSIYDALKRADIRGADVFRDKELGWNVCLRRRQS